MSNSPQKRCILAIGETGLGKSFTATVFGAKGVKVGHSTESETDKVTFYDIGNGSFYVDTPGFNDSDEEKSDDETVRLILREMQDRKISKITTILWFVRTDGCRATTSLKSQARTIEAFARDHNGNVWDNTIIVTKGDERGEGPRAAAEEIAKKIHEQKPHHRELNAKKSFLENTGYFEIRLFESLSERKKDIYATFPIETLDKLNIFKRSEPERILAKYRLLMEGHTNHPIVLEFKKVKCLNCSEETDPRLASPKCHLKIIKIHKPWKNYHSKEIGQFHSTELVKEWDHSIGAWTVRVITIGIVNPQTYEYECCGRKTPHDCGNNKCEPDNCKITPGCISVCERCKKIPGTNEGCSTEGKHNWGS
ncbi:7997_t:CDS:2, partial [Paraglomus brasilianum]